MKDFDVPLDAQRYTALGKHLKKIAPPPPKKIKIILIMGNILNIFKGFPFSQRNWKKRDKEDSQIS